MKTKCNTAALSAALFMLAGPAVSANWNAGADMAAIERPNGAQELANPNGPWSYGAKSSATATAMTLYTPAQHYNSLYTANQDGYDNADGHILSHLGPTVYAPYSLPIQPLEMHWHPSINAGLFTTLRWTAPAAGTYYISAYWKDINHSGGNGATAHLVVNGTQVFGQTFQNTVSAVVRNQQITLSAGDTVDFALGNNGEWSGDGTSFNAFVSTSPLNVVAHYRFENGPDAGAVSTLTDSSQHQLHGTSTGEMFYRANTATHSAMGAFSLDAVGDNDFGQVADNPLLHQQGDWTVEAFFKLDDPYNEYGATGAAMILAKQNQTAGSNYQGGFAIEVNPSTGRPSVTCSLSASTGMTATGTTDTRTNPRKWYHVAAVMDRDVSGTTDQLSIYVDGVLEGAVHGVWGDLYYGNQPLYIGAGNFDGINGSTYRRNFDGHIDEVRISAAALTPPQFLAPGPAITHHTSTWNSTTGNWSDGSKWITPTAFGTFPNNGSPIPTYDAIQNGGVLTVNQDIQLQKFTMTGGTNTGAGSILSVNGLFAWSNGTLNGTGPIHATGGGSIFQGSLSTGRSLNTEGTITWNGDNIFLNNSGIINNSGIWNATNNRQFLRESAGVFNNLAGAAFNKSGGDFTQVEQPFNNQNGASVSVTSGELRLQVGGTQAGAFHVGSGAALQLMGGHALNAGVSFNGAGTLHIGGTNVATITANTAVTFPSTLNVNLVERSGSPNRLEGPGAITVNSPLTWNNNNLIGGSSTAEEITFNNTLTISGPVSGGSTHTHNKRTMYTTATTNWTASDNFLDNYGIINNSGTWNATSRQFMKGDGGQFNNLANGVFNKSGANITYFQQPFVNAGTLNVNSGTLQFQLGGSYSQTAGALVLGGGTVNAGSFSIQGGKVQGGGTITGAVSMSNGTSMEPGIGTSTGSLNISDNLNLSSGSKLSFDIGGITPGTGHDQINEGGAAALSVSGVTLEVNLLNGFLPAIGETITVVQASTAAITGSFANVLNGARLNIEGTSYSCQVNYGTNTAFAASGGNRKVILSHFATTPTDLLLNDNLIRENTAAPKTVGLLSATDPNTSETFTFELTTVSGLDPTDDDNGLFEIVGDNQLQAKSSTALDFELKNSYKVRLRVRNSRGATLEKAFTIEVQDVLPPTSVSITPSIIAENQPVGSPGATVGTFSATDPDPDATFTYGMFLTTTPFEVVGNELRAKQVFNKEATPAPGPFNLQINVTNDRGETAVLHVTVTVLDQGPTAIALTPAIALANQVNATVGTLSATVVPTDTAISTWSLVSGGPDNALFTLDGSTVKTAGALSASTPTRSIRVRAVDANNEAFEQDLTISVVDVEITDIALSGTSVLENLPAGTVVADLSATLQPADPLAAPVFSIVSATPSDALEVINDNQLVTTRPLKLANEPTISIRLQAEHMGAVYEEDAVITVGANAASLTLQSATGLTLGTGTATLAVGDVTVGSTVTKTLTLHNPGPGQVINVSILNPADPDDDATASSADLLNDANLAPGETVSVEVTFSPQVHGSRSSVVRFQSANTEDYVLTVTGRGIGPEITVFQPVGTNLESGDTVDFGLQPLTVNFPAKTFTVRNTGLLSSLSSLMPTITGPDAAFFTLDRTGTNPTLTTGLSTTFKVKFQPDELRTYTATLSLSSNDADENPFELTLTGEAVTPLVIAQEAYAKASDTQAGDLFGGAGSLSGNAPFTEVGSSVAVSGNTVVVGAPLEDGSPTISDSGSVYVFVRDTTSGTWSQQAKLRASDASTTSSFGVSVAISGDTLVIGANGEDRHPLSSLFTLNNSGAAYVFVRNGVTWSQQAKLRASNAGASDAFGSAVSISGDSIVVGAPREASAANTVNGNAADNSASLAGAAYVFVRSGAVWTQQSYLKASNAGAGDTFGESVSIDGDTIIVGADDESSSTTTGPSSTGHNNLADNAGAAYVFSRTSGVWTEEAYLKAASPVRNAYFGQSVAVSGSTIAVGAYQQDQQTGAVHVFEKVSNVWLLQTMLKATNPATSALFGFHVALSGNLLLASAPAESGIVIGINGNQELAGALGAGAAYVFQKTPKGWAQQAYLKASNTQAGDNFGSAVALSSDLLVAGALYEDSNAVGINGNGANNTGTDSGAAYFFKVQSRSLKVFAGNGLAGSAVENGQALPVSLGASAPGTPLTGSFTLFNDWPLGLNISSLTVSGDFELTLQGNPALAGKGTMGFTIASIPGATGLISGEVEIVSDDPELPPFTFSITGLIDPATPTEVAVQNTAGTNYTDGASALNFGAQTYSRTMSQTLTVKNVGANPLFIRSIHFSGEDTADFTATTAATEVPAGGSTTLTVSFAPASATPGAKAATLHLLCNDLDEGSYEIRLTGSALVPELNTADSELEIGVAPFGLNNVSTEKVFNLRNDGQGVLEDLVYSIEGAHAAEFSIVSSVSSVAAGRSAQIKLGCLPTAEGLREAVLKIESNDPDESPLFIGLSADGVEAPTITEAPEPVLALAGESVTLSVNATGTPPLTYRWLKDGTHVGSNSPFLTLNNVTTASKGIYTCRVSNAAGIVTSVGAPLAVVTASTVTSLTANEDNNVSMKIPALAAPSGSVLTIQWKKDGVPVTNSTTAPVISGATGQKLLLTGVKPAAAGTYTCEVTMAGVPVSREALRVDLIVIAKPVIIEAGPFQWGVAVPVTDQMEAANSPTTWAASRLPSGVTINSGTGQLSGKPTTAGSNSFTVTATNVAGSHSRTFDYSVSALPASLAGGYYGLVDRSSMFGLRQLGGRFTMNVTVTGSWTGTLNLGPKAYSFSVAASNPNTRLEGERFHAQVLVNRSAESLHNLNLDVEINTVTGELTGGLTDATAASPAPSSVLVEARKKASSTSFAPTGTFTAALDLVSAAAGNAAIPQGTSFCRFSHNSTLGQVSFTIHMSDDTTATYSLSSTIVEGGRIPVHLSQYGATVARAGSLMGWVTLSADVPPLVNKGRPLADGSFTWFKNAQASTSSIRSYKEGIPLHGLALSGGVYAPPAAGEVMLGLPKTADNARFEFSEGGLETTSLGAPGSPAGSPSGIIRQTCTINDRQVIMTPNSAAGNPATVTATFGSANGMLEGTFKLTDPDSRDTTTPIAQITRTANFRGVMVPRLGKVAGYFQLALLPTVVGKAATSTPLLSGQMILEENP